VGTGFGEPGGAVKLYFVPRYRPRGPAHDAKACRDALALMCLRHRIATGSSYPLGPVDDPFFPVAVHEAGHALAARLTEGPTIGSVRISETLRGGVSGRVRFLNADAVNCTILLAGMAAERVVLGFCEKECAWSDLDRARSIARSTTCSDVEGFLDRALQKTIALIEIHRDALLALAGEITDKRYLSGGEVNRIITKALAGAH
jgi:hypothetical protein